MIKTVCVIALFLSALTSVAADPINLVGHNKATPRARFGMGKLATALRHAGYTVSFSFVPKKNISNIIIGTVQQVSGDTISSREGFVISGKADQWRITGADETGVLYGCLEMIDRLAGKKLPANPAIRDAPEMVLRGACVGLQKTDYLPGREVYEYPYTPETFPWFYDKQLWTRFLDSLLENRMNSLYLWNGHPFASLVKLKDYPYAVEVDEATFKKNEEMFRFLTQEADKRGIWVIQMFYNIIVSKPFAEKNGLKTQDRARPIIPIIADYTRKSIAAFVQKYPNVGLLVALGEAMEGDDMDVEWFTKTIIPGVKDGLKLLGKKDEPPIVLRGHDTDPERVMKAALPLYKNLYTEAKYNGEALTTYTPRGPWAEMHRALGNLGTVHIDNVHILANLEPFRYAAASFIQKSVQAMHAVHYANGLHLYPEASYWDWPYTADKSASRILQIDRDWLWYKQWGRYAWNAGRDPLAEKNYWASMAATHYKISPAAGDKMMRAFEESGEISPKLLRRFGISNGNRQTLNLGMTMSQLVNPTKWRVWPDLYTSDGPEGETLVQYAAIENAGSSHKGETPVQIIEEVKAHGDKAVAAIDSAAATGVKNNAEFDRIKNDMYCYRALAYSFAEKASAAALVLKYGYSSAISDLDTALTRLEKSVYWYRQLVDLTKDHYLYANSMQTKQRKIPVGGDDGKNKTWAELLPFYQSELDNFKRKLDSIKTAGNGKSGIRSSRVYLPADVKVASTQIPLRNGAKLFSDTTALVAEVSPALANLMALQTAKTMQLKEGTSVSFESTKPVNLLIGYFNSTDPRYLQPPNLETNATANNYGQAEPKILNAILLQGMPAVNIHSYSFPAGKHQLVLGKGICIVAGFTAETVEKIDAGLGKKTGPPVLDWLFEK